MLVRIFCILAVTSLAGCTTLDHPARPSTAKSPNPMCKTLKEQLMQISTNEAFDKSGTDPLKQARLYRTYQAYGCEPISAQ